MESLLLSVTSMSLSSTGGHRFRCVSDSINRLMRGRNLFSIKRSTKVWFFCNSQSCLFCLGVAENFGRRIRVVRARTRTSACTSVSVFTLEKHILANLQTNWKRIRTSYSFFCLTMNDVAVVMITIINEVGVSYRSDGALYGGAGVVGGGGGVAREWV